MLNTGRGMNFFLKYCESVTVFYRPIFQFHSEANSSKLQALEPKLVNPTTFIGNIVNWELGTDLIEIQQIIGPFIHPSS